MNVHLLRIVLSSPSDVPDQREAVREAVEDVNQFLRTGSVPYQFIVSAWERDAIPGLHTSGPQARIDEALKIPECDFLIGIFSKRFGRPVGGAGSGTEYEIRQAMETWAKKGSPQVMLYFDVTPFTPCDPEAERQFERLKAFEKEVRAMPIPPLVHHYAGSEEFRRAATRHLFDIANALYQPTRVHAPFLNFSASATVAHVRSEGYTDLVGDISVKCTCVKETRMPWFALVVYLNTSVTCRVASQTEDSISEAMLTEVGRAIAPEIHFGKVWGNRISFPQVHLEGLKLGESRLFRITNIRCVSYAARITAALTVGTQSIDNGVLDVGKGTQALRFEAEGRTLVDLTEVANGSQGFLAYTPLKLTFSEEFLGAFKARFSTKSRPYLSDDHGVVVLAETNPTSPRVAIPGSTHMAGEADTGTRFKAYLGSVDAKVRVFVSVRNISPEVNGAQAEIVKTASGCAGTAPHVVLDGIEYCEIGLVSGVLALPEWELIGRKEDRKVILQFMVALLLDRRNASDRSFVKSECSINGSLAYHGPQTSSASSSSILPVPRFGIGMLGPPVEFEYWRPRC